MSDPEEVKRERIAIFLDMAIPLKIAELQARGGPSKEDYQRAREIGFEIAEGIDDRGAEATASLIETHYSRTATSKKAVGDLLGRMAFALAVGAFCPNGTPPFLGRRWNANA